MADQKVKEILDAFHNLKPFGAASYVDPLGGQLSLQDPGGMYDKAPTTLYNEVPSDDYEILEKFKVQTIVIGISRNSRFSFNRAVKADGIQGKMQAGASSLAHVLYRDYLESVFHSSTNSHLDLSSLEKDSDFCVAFATRVLDPDFINRILIWTYINESKIFAEAIAFIYERVRKTLAKSHPELSSRSAKSHWEPHAKKNSDLKNIQQVDEFLTTSLPIKWSDEKSLQGPSFPAMGDQLIEIWFVSPKWQGLVSSAISEMRSTPDWVRQGSGGHFPVTVPGSDIYAERLLDWVKNQSSKYGEYFSSWVPDTIVQHPATWLTCFVSGTKVSTARGNVPIEDLEPDECVLTKAPAEYGLLSDEKPYESTMHGGEHMSKLPLFGFNDEEPFFTAGHIFFTMAGPKAIAPSVAREENPSVAVSRLYPGDVLYRLDPERLVYRKVKLESFTVGTADGRGVYGLHFRQGSHGGARYHANGYLVAANYPEVTIKRFANHLAALPIRRQREAVSSIQRLPSNLSAVFGSLFPVFKKEFGPDRPRDMGDIQPILEQAERRRREQRHPAHALVREFDLTPVSINSKHNTTRVSICNGAVLVNERLVQHAEVTHEYVHWSVKLPDEKWQHGSIRLNHNALVAHGAIAVVPDARSLKSKADLSSTDATVTAVVGTVPSIVNTPLATDKTFATAREADLYVPSTSEGHTTFWTVKLTVYQDKTGGFSPLITIPALDSYVKENKLISIYTSNPLPDKKFIIGQAQIVDGNEFAVDDAISKMSGQSKPPNFKRFTIKLNALTGEIHGHYSESVSKDGYIYTEGPIHSLYQQVDDGQAKLVATVSRQISESEFADKHYGLQCNLYSVSANIHEKPRFSTMLLAPSDDSPLSIPELQNMDIPDSQTSHELTQNYLMAAAGYWRGEKETNLFGDGKPANEDILPDSLKKELSDDNRKFFSDSYSRGLFLHSLCTDEKYASRFNKDDKEKLTYFWRGKSKGCISVKSQLGSVSTIAANESLLKAVPRLRQYRNDGSVDWAEKYYTFLSSDTQLNIMALAKVYNKTDLLTQHCQVLDVIDRTNNKYDQKLGGPVDANGWPKYATEFAEVLFEKIASNDPKVAKELREELHIDMAALKEAYGVDSAAQLAARLYGAGTELGRFFQAFFKQGFDFVGKKNMAGFAKMMSWVKDQYQKKMPDEWKSTGSKVWKSLTAVTSIIAQGIQIWQAVVFLMNWDNLNPADRAAGILQIVQSTLTLVGDAVGIYRMFRDKADSEIGLRQASGQMNAQIGGEKPRIRVEVDGNEQEVIETHELAQVNTEEGIAGTTIEEQVATRTAASEIEEEVTSRFNLAESGELALAAVTVLANVAVAVGLGIRIAKEWDTESVGIKVLDIISLSTTIAQVSLGIAEIALSLAGVESMILPGLGAVVALIGIVLMFVEMFVPRKPPEDPVNKYIDANASTFVEDITSPPQPELTYSVPKKLTVGDKSATLEINMSNPQTKPVKINNFMISLPVGDDKSDLFKKPIVAEDQKSVQNGITCTVTGNKGYTSKAILDQSSANDRFNILIKNTQKEIPVFDKLTATISGTVNDSGDTGTISIQEVPTEDVSGKATTDRIKEFTVKRS
ncbi:hypothetical protein N7478_008731 [Penicillium angulare]|uniref:uncharacterized protein n=1 Tax=Penicillium angulare TaxID=116970 RepID=UPI002541DEE3|nr:uncharacterized protein N7478_008731 [Penicillium angulare]KAJ5273606.1 hypothetical protein N7478_008731 [Penicillium angulare]